MSTTATRRDHTCFAEIAPLMPRRSMSLLKSSLDSTFHTDRAARETVLKQKHQTKGELTVEHFERLLGGLLVAGDDFARVQAHADQSLCVVQQLAGKAHNEVAAVADLRIEEWDE